MSNIIKKSKLSFFLAAVIIFLIERTYIYFIRIKNQATSFILHVDWTDCFNFNSKSHI